MSPETLASRAVERLRSVRAQTVQLFELATSEAVLRSEPMPGFRPLLWHLAHIGVYQNYWMLQRCAGQASINPLYDIYFDPIKTPQREAPVLPERAEIDAYLDETLERVEAFVERADLDAPQPDGRLSPAYALGLVYEHECQHQETIAFVMQTLPFSQKKDGPPPLSGTRGAAAAEIFVPKGQAQIGARPFGFAYDNELPPQTIEFESFFIDRDLVTNGEYAQFVERDGYGIRELWSDDGWAWKQEAGVTLPLGWSAPPLRERGFFGEIELREDAPVTGVSWYEAQAYAAFRDRRLPTEFEWEVAAAWDPARGQMRRFVWGDDERFEREQPLSFSTHPVGSRPDSTSALGMHDACNNLWQWTSSAFLGYPGFAAYPYPEYSQLWFDSDHYVARGGSWYTFPAITRTSFRNFYRRHFRPAFIGIRCARDAR
ncbi:MAG TPA: SUMF1/EgtB/PvdO family nonheme iron enzyme [Candidatus Acidoferrales bacterium]|nr:SUMF1/EgtB/PvdO family nonheme iron enzyme [Candidatus Acidoferrales bacterium]